MSSKNGSDIRVKRSREISLDIDEESKQSFAESIELLDNCADNESNICADNESNNCADSESIHSFFSCIENQVLNTAEESLQLNELSFGSELSVIKQKSEDSNSELQSSSVWSESIDMFDESSSEPKELTISYRENRLNSFRKLLLKSKHFSDIFEKSLTEQKTSTTEGRKRRLNEESIVEEEESSSEDCILINGENTNGLTYRQVLQQMNGENEDNLMQNNRSVRNKVNNRTNSRQYRPLDQPLVIDGKPLDKRQPFLVSGTVMRDYQLEGLDWLRVLHSNNVNGILADEMGLGKTIQAIALIAHLIQTNETDPHVGPFLVVAPLSTLHNWKREFEKFAPLIPALVFHGNYRKLHQLEKEMDNLVNIYAFRKTRKCYPVIITSYDILRRYLFILRRRVWSYVVVDEGHKLKSINTLISGAMRKIVSKNRVILTGTPLHNNLPELWALLNYTSPEIFNDWQIFEDLLASNSSNEQIIQQEMDLKIVSSIHQILSTFMLRRTKAEVGLNLPQKKEILVYVPSTQTQQTLYEIAVNLVKAAKSNSMKDYFTIELDLNGGRKRRKCSKMIDYTQYYKDIEDDFEDDLETNPFANQMLFELPKELSSDRMSSEYVSFGRFNRNNIFMQMRKITNHPYLVQWPLDPRTQQCILTEDLIRSSGKMRALDELLEQLYSHKHRVLLFSQMTKMLTILEEYCDFRGYRFVRFDGNTHLDERQKYIEMFNKDNDIFIFLLSTRAGGLGINLIGADTAIIYDSDWNPQMDLQAQDRCHRIGQTKPVVIYRLVTAHTVDDHMLTTAKNKRKLDKMIIRKGLYFQSTDAADKKPKSITLDELLNILESTDFKAIYNYSLKRLESNRLFSEEDMQKMLDRSPVSEHLKESLIEIGV